MVMEPKYQKGQHVFHRIGDEGMISHVEVMIFELPTEECPAYVVYWYGLNELKLADEDHLDDPATIIKNTRFDRQFAWPPGTFIQGHQRRTPNEQHPNRNAFVEICPPEGSFFRADAPSVTEAEAKAWERYQKMIACGEHGPYEPRHYDNGAGFCTRCGTWFSDVCPEAKVERPPSPETQQWLEMLEADDEEQDPADFKAALEQVLGALAGPMPEEMLQAKDQPEAGK